MTKPKYSAAGKAPDAAPKPAAPKAKRVWPQAGGTYTRCVSTGKLTRDKPLAQPAGDPVNNQPPVDPANTGGGDPGDGAAANTGQEG